MRRSIAVLITILLLGGTMFAGGRKEAAAAAIDSWRPTKPINLIVPWAAGGSTDRSARATAGILEEFLGQKIVVVNQPGASGSVGTKTAMEAARDGYTWTAGAAKDLGNYKVKGLLDTSIKDWHLFLNVAMPNIVSVHADSPYKDFGELLAGFKANPDQVKVATAGINSAGHTAIELIKKFAGITYKHVPYDGGNPAVIAVVSGEADVVPQLSLEQVDMLRAKRLRALAVLSDKPLTITGIGTIEAVTRWVPNYKGGANYFGLFLPRGVPETVVRTLSRIWDERIKTSDALKKFAEDNGMIFDPEWGDAAVAKAMPMISLDAWLTFDTGKAVVNPETLGIPRP